MFRCRVRSGLKGDPEGQAQKQQLPKVFKTRVREQRIHKCEFKLYILVTPQGSQNKKIRIHIAI